MVLVVASKPVDDDPFGQMNPSGMRLWTDANGQYKVEARFVSVLGDTVRLQKTNGRYVRILLVNLCDVDQQLVRRVEAVATNW